MKLLRIIASADPRTGGPIEGILRGDPLLAAAGHSQDLATLDRPDDGFLDRVPMRLFPLGRRPGDRLGAGALIPARYGYSPRLLPWLRAHVRDYDAVIVSGLWNYATMAARQALVGAGVPYVVFTHGMLDPWFRRRYPLKHVAKQLLWPAVEGPLLAHAGAVLFTSEEERDLARNVFRPYRLTERVVAYGTAEPADQPDAQRSAFAAAVPQVEGRPFLLFLSRIHQKKGCDLLVEAFAAIAARAPDLHLVVAGPDQNGLVPGFRARAAALGIGDRVHWPGMLAGDAKWGAFRACAATILPSHQENFGIAVVEAASCGAPLLISDKVNIWREFVDAGAGIVAPDTLEGTRLLIERFVALDAEARARMGANARSLFRARFEIGAAAHDLIAVLEDQVRRR